MKRLESPCSGRSRSRWLTSGSCQCCRLNEEYRESLLRQEQKRLADLAACQAKTTPAFQRAGGEALTQNLAQQQAADEARMRKLQVSPLCRPLLGVGMGEGLFVKMAAALSQGTSAASHRAWNSSRWPKRPEQVGDHAEMAGPAG